MRKLVGSKLSLLTGLVMLVALAGCTQARMAVVQPALTEEVAWVTMLQTWSGTAYKTHDFYAGLTSCSLMPFKADISGRMQVAIDGVTAGSDMKGIDFNTGCAGGSRLAFYAVSGGQGITWVINKLISIGVPITIGGV